MAKKPVPDDPPPEPTIAYSITMLGDLGGGEAQARGMNNLGDVVGTSRTAEGDFNAFLYTSQWGMEDLNSIHTDPQWDLNMPNDINDSGQIVGQQSLRDDDGDGVLDRGSAAFRYTPGTDTAPAVIEELVFENADGDNPRPMAINNDGVVDALGGVDSLTVDLGGRAFGLPIDYRAGSSGGDALSVVGSGATATLVFVNETDGSVEIDGQVISYTGLTPIDMTGMNVDNLVLSFDSANDETVTLSDDGTAGDGNLQIDSTAGELLTFATPGAALTVRTDSGGGADTISVEGLDAAWDANLNISGNSDDLVVFGPNTTNLGGGNLEVAAQTIIVKEGIATSGDGSITAEATRDIRLWSGANVRLVDGNLTLRANQGATPTTGDFTGIALTEATLEITGTGQIVLEGRGGTGETDDGIRLLSGASVSSTGSGSIFLEGTTATGVSGVFLNGDGTRRLLLPSLRTGIRRIPGEAGHLELPRSPTGQWLRNHQSHQKGSPTGRSERHAVLSAVPHLSTSRVATVLRRDPQPTQVSHLPRLPWA